MNKQETIGNAAKMREAVGNALWCLNWMSENTGDKPTKDHLAKPIELLTAALAAPARNCDMFDDYKSAKDYFLENELWKYNRDLTPEYWFGVWLFELAEKGGSEATTVDAV